MSRTVAAQPQAVYNVHPAVAMVQKQIAELRGKTGRSLEGWIALIKKEGPKDPKSRSTWLKDRHKLGTVTARWLAERADGKGVEEEAPQTYLKAAAEYVEQQYAGRKENLRPLYEHLLQLGKSCGADVKACPCKTMVPLYRNHVFAQLKATTHARIDLGLALAHYKGKLPGRLVDTGGLAKKDRITHRIELHSADQIDGDVKKWLQTAYALDA